MRVGYTPINKQPTLSMGTNAHELERERERERERNKFVRIIRDTHKCDANERTHDAYTCTYVLLYCVEYDIGTRIRIYIGIYMRTMHNMGMQITYKRTYSTWPCELLCMYA